MEKYKSNDILKATDDLIDTIIKSDIYIKHIKLQEKIAENKEILKEIENIKKLEQAYVKSDFKEDKYKKQMDDDLVNLRKKPLYKMYEQSLDEINDILEQIKDGLNETFMDMINS